MLFSVGSIEYNHPSITLSFRAGEKKKKKERESPNNPTGECARRLHITFPSSYRPIRLQELVWRIYIDRECE